MRVLIAGGLGFIGHNVALQLKNQGHTVAIVDDKFNYEDSTSHLMDRIYGLRQKRLSTDIEIYRASIVDADLVDWIFSKFNPEIIINCASPSNQRLVKINPTLSSAVMIRGLITLLEASVKSSVSRFVHLSSSMVYGNFTNDVTESHVCNPIGQYGILKLAGELLIREYANKNLSHTIIRPSAVYGPLDRPDRVISKFIYQASVGGNLEVRGANEFLDFTHVNDLATGIVQASFTPRTRNKAYNITRNRARSIYDAANEVVNAVGSGRVIITDRDDDFPSRGRLSIAAARTDFNFKPTIDLEQGIQQCCESFLSGENFYDD